MIEGVSKTNENEANEHKGGLISMLLGTLSVSFLGNLTAGKGVIWTREGFISLRQDF